MSADDQAAAYLEEARLTLASARAIHREATEAESNLWAQVVKNAYDAIEQAISAAIAARDESIPRAHPAKITTFVDLTAPATEIEETLLYWLQRRSDAQYVDIRDDRVEIPHEKFDRDDADRIIDDAQVVIAHVEEQID